ncbi:MAG: tetraprenyl-beta-curcumene synthase family protein [Candidatus Amoebophilus sp.]
MHYALINGVFFLDKTLISRLSNNPVLIYRFIKYVFPKVRRELNHWRSMAAVSPDPILALGACESIRTKSFHCQGGSIYALYPGVDMAKTVEFIVAYQTISDYLDNLVDSLEVQDEMAFAQLHLAMRDALCPEYGTTDYYLYFPYREDGGYLDKLVKSCQVNISSLPSYELIKPDILWLANLYAHLQTYKHLALDKRESKMLTWINSFRTSYPLISEWEFAAATGSTLGIFCLYALAYNPALSQEQVKTHKEVYFPWIAGLHILLDYFIDLAEDKETGQLNFVQYYDCSQKTRDRLEMFSKQAWAGADKLDYPNFHKLVLQGLLAMYLSDPKSSDLEIQSTTKQVLQEGGIGVRLLHGVCRKLRKHGII